MDYLIVGLGNVGAEYAGTRHNIGFMVLDAWAQASNAVFRSCRMGYKTKIQARDDSFLLLKPSTYMNLSGRAVKHWVKKTKLPLDKLLVISDDLNLPFGMLRLRKSGSSGGHNGLANINEALNTQDYARLRIGIGSDYNEGERIDYVLGNLKEEEREMMKTVSKKAIEGIKLFASAGIERAMNIVNTNAK